jgi:uncharacterized protein YqgV (UPF0045/DUF77 family)
MRNMEKTGLVSCQLSFYPLGTPDTNKSVKEVVKIIEKSGLESEVNDMSTIIKGNIQETTELLGNIQQIMDKNGISYTLVAIISNVCGCKR